MGAAQNEALDVSAASGDPRLGWIVSDLMRFAWKPQLQAGLSDAANGGPARDLPCQNAWGALLHKSFDGRSCPFSRRAYPTASVTGMPSAV